MRMLLKGGLVGAASPGSIFAELAMTPRGGFVANIAGITVACLVTFLLASLLLKAFVRDEDEDLEASTAKMKQMKAESKGQTLFLYTDGVPEATNTENKLYGEERLLAFMNQNASVEAVELLPALIKIVAEKNIIFFQILF